MQSETRIILNAGGPPSKAWGNHTGTTKHLVEVPTPEGGTEPLLVRTIRQLRLRHLTDIWLIRDPTDRRYDLDGVTPYPHTNVITSTAAILHTQPLWNNAGRTISLMSDWFYTASTLNRILGDQANQFKHLARIGGSELNGQPWSEDAGVSFWPDQHPEYLAALRHVEALGRQNLLPRAGAWETWTHLAGVEDTRLWSVLNDPEVLDLPRRLDLGDDGSSDFDLPEFYETWLAAVRRGAINLRY
jgi:hypothetical protein